MKMARSAVMGLAAALLVTSVACAEAQNTEKKHEGKKEGIFKEMNLTPEQDKKLEENRKAHREEMTKLHTSMKEKQSQLSLALKSPAVTRAVVDPIVNEIKSLQAQLIDLRINGIFSVKEILTPEQFAKFQEVTEKLREGRKGHMQKHGEKKESSKQN